MWRFKKRPFLLSRDPIVLQKQEDLLSKTHNREPCYLSDKGKEICIDHLNAFTVLGHPPQRVLLSLLFFCFLAKNKKKNAEGHGILKWICLSPKPIVILVGTQSYTFWKGKGHFKFWLYGIEDASRNKAQWRWGRKGRVPWDPPRSSADE